MIRRKQQLTQQQGKSTNSYLPNQPKHLFSFP
jgi:hypothetical protein